METNEDSAFKKILLIFKLLFVKFWKKVYGFFASIPYAKLGREFLNATGNFMHWLLFNVLIPPKHRGISKKKIYSIIFKSDTPAGKKFDIILLVLIGVNLLMMILDSFPAISGGFSMLLKIGEWVFTILFTLEYYLRIYCISNPRKYIFTFYGVIDFLSIFPSYLSLFFPATHTLAVLRILRALRIFRIFKMEKFITESTNLLSSLTRSASKILIFMMFVFIMAVILGALIFMVEGDQNPQINSIPQGIYWAVVTITTVGYGDIAPVTVMGRLLAIIVMLLGYSIIAVPTGIVVGDAITTQQESKKRKKQHGQKDEEMTHANNLESSSDDSPAEFDLTEENVVTKHCPHCGYQEEDVSSMYCRHCGTRLKKEKSSSWINNFFAN